MCACISFWSNVIAFVGTVNNYQRTVKIYRRKGIVRKQRIHSVIRHGL